MATARVKEQKIEKLGRQRAKLAARVTRAGEAVREAQAQEAALKAQLQKLDSRIEWQRAEPVDEEDDPVDDE